MSTPIISADSAMRKIPAVLLAFVGLIATHDLHATDAAQDLKATDIPQNIGQQYTPTESRLMERAKKYWDAVKIHDYPTVYQMEATAVKGWMSADKVYRSISNSNLDGFNIKEAKLDGEKAVITLERLYRWKGKAAAVPMDSSDPWIFFDGDWYHAYGIRLNAINPSEWAKLKPNAPDKSKNE